jgi:hypothetical protein
MTTYNTESHTSTTLTAESHGSVTMTDESMGSVTMSDEVMGYPLYCDNNDILCNTSEYDCLGARIMHPWTHTTTTMTAEAYS